MSLPWDCHTDGCLRGAQRLVRGNKRFQWSRMTNLLLTNKKSSGSIRARCSPSVSGHNQRLMQKLLPWSHAVSQPVLGQPSPLSWGRALPTAKRLQNVHGSSSQLKTAVARELLKVKKTAQDERRAAAEGSRARGCQMGSWKGGGRWEGQEKERMEECRVEIFPHLATEQQFSDFVRTAFS